MFSHVANRGLGWKKSTCCRPARFPLRSILGDFVCSTDDIYGHYDADGNIPPLACCFSKAYNSSNILAVSDENGFITLFNTNLPGKNSVLRNWNAHSNAVFDLAWVENTEKILTASGDQTIVLWDTLSMERVQIFTGHVKSVKSVSVKPNDPAIFCSGSRDGQILIYDMRANSKDGFTPNVNAIKNAHTTSPALNPPKKTRSHLNWRSNSTKNLLSLDRHKSVTSVLFHTDNLLVSAGAVNNHIKVWDLRKCSSSQMNPTPVYTFSSALNAVRNHGITNLVFDSTCTKIFASCKDNKIYQYDFASYSPSPVKVFHGFENASFYIKSSVSPCDQYLISGSHDNTAYIWDIENSSGYPCTQLAGHTAEVTTVAWSPCEFNKIATLSDDNTLRLWRIQRNNSLVEKNSNWGTACDYIIPSCDNLIPSSPNSTCSTNEKPLPTTPDLQRPSHQSSPPLSLVGWLKTSAHRENNPHLRTDCTPVTETPENSKTSITCEGSPSKQSISVNGKTRVLAKRNLENAYDELHPCSSSSKKCNVLRSPNRGDDKLAIKLEDVEAEDGQTEILKWLDVSRDHCVSDIESKSQEENLSPCQTRTVQNWLSEQTSSCPRSDETLPKNILHSLIPLSAILKTPTRHNLYLKSSPSESKKRRTKTPKTPNSARKTPHKSSPTVMSGKQSILSYLNTNGSPTNL